MKTLNLSQGQVAQVDDEDFEYLNQWKWYADKWGNNNFYAMRKVNNGDGTWTRFTMHRVLMNAQDGCLVDHIDGNGLNNQKNNLRIVTPQQNTFNRTTSKPGRTSGRVGVKKSSWDGHWEAYIRVNGKYIHLGTFQNLSEAVEAREAGEIKYFGEFARMENR